MSNNYQRLFYIFQSMDNEVGNPTGYIKVEINGPAAKLQISLNNMVFRTGMEYKLYGIQCIDGRFSYTLICNVEVNNGRTDMKVSVDTSNIGNNKLDFDSINVFALITQLPDKDNSVICPLVAYKNRKVEWKHIFEAELKKSEIKKNDNIDAIGKNILDNNDKVDKNKNNENENHIEPDSGMLHQIDTFATEKAELDQKNTLTFSPAIKAAEKTEYKAGYTGQENGTEAEEQSLFSEADAERDDLCEDTVGDLSDLVEADTGTVEADTGSVEVNTGNSENTVELDASAAEEYKEQQTSDPHSVHHNFSSSVPSEEENLSDSVSAGDKTEYNSKESDSGLGGDNFRNITSKFEATLTSIYNNTADGDNFLAETDIIGTAEQNYKDITSIKEKGDKVRTELDIDALREELDRSFEPCNPFNTKSKRFVWWKINSPGYLNNILFRNNIKTYLLFNPKVMLAHYKYKYIIFGIRYDKYSGRERLVCGVPGVYSIDDNPFGSMGSWAQLEGFKPKYGAFGYWVILIDPRTGKLMKIK